MGGSGEIIKCPKCNSGYIEVTSIDEVGKDTKVQHITCNNCGSEYVETWNCVGWEEE